MPLLETERLQKIILPSTANLPADQQEWVVMDISQLKGADLDAIDENAEKNIMKFFGQIVTLRIREWNVTEANGELAELSAENIGRLPLEDRAHLYAQIDQNGGEQVQLPKVPTENSPTI
jgi:hypothetical protein